MKKSYDVIVIGAGHNGLTTAAYLARHRYRVLVLEQRPHLGGTAAREEFHPGYQTTGLWHDTTHISHAAVKALGLESYGLQYRPTPSIFVPQPASAGKGLFLHHDPQLAAEEIAAFSKEDAAQYAAYRTFLDAVSGVIRNFVDQPPPPFLQSQGQQLWPLFKSAVGLRRLGKRRMMELLRALPMSTADWLDEWFQTDLLKAALAAPALYGTCHGPRSPASNAPLLLHECTIGQGIKGGAAALIDLLETCAKQGHAEIRTDAKVARIQVEQGVVTGVKLDNGELFNARIVATSCNPKHTFLDLLHPRILPKQLEQRILHYRSRGTTAKINIALNRPAKFACRPEHTIEFARISTSLTDQEKAFDASKYRQFSSRPLLDIFIPTATMPTLAPKGHHVMSILAHFAPYHLEGGWTEAQNKALGDAVVETLKLYIPDIKEAIVAKEVLDPAALEARYGLTEGHIFHGEPALDQLLIRPIPECAHYKTPIDGLFVCGSGSHPGGGLTCRPGLLAAKAIEQTLVHAPHAHIHT